MTVVDVLQVVMFLPVSLVKLVLVRLAMLISVPLTIRVVRLVMELVTALAMVVTLRAMALVMVVAMVHILVSHTTTLVNNAMVVKPITDKVANNVMVVSLM